MKLRWKASIIIVVISICLIAVLKVASDALLLQGVANVEHETATENAERIRDIITQRLFELDLVVSDWAFSNSTYAFIQNNNTEFAVSNLANKTFIDLKLNFMLFFNSSGQLVFGRAFNLTDKTNIPVPQSLSNYLTTDKNITVNEDMEDYENGIIILPEGPIMIASRPVLTSEHQGPIQGTLVIGRFLDQLEVESFVEKTFLTISLHVVNDPSMPPDFQAANSSLSEDRVFVQPLSDQITAGYVLVNDIYGDPALIMKFDMSRDFYAQSQTTGLYVTFALALAGVIFGGTTTILLEKFVLAPLSSLSDDVSRIGKTGDFGARVVVSGKDELSDLGNDINKTLSKLEQTTRRLEVLLATAREGIVAVDSNEKITFANKAFVDMIGCEQNELIGLNVERLLDDEGIEKIAEETEKRKRGGTSRYDLVFYRKDGEPRIAQLSASPLRNEDGSYEGALSIVMDVTESKLLEQALLKSQQKFERLFTGNPEAIAFVDENAHILEINPRFTELFGYLPEEAKGRGLNDLIVPEVGKEEAVALTSQSLLGFINRETVRKDKSGTIIPVLISAAPITIEGEFKGCVISYRDITERKKIEEQLRESEEKFRGIAERSFDAIATVDLKGMVAYASPSVEKVLGYSAEEEIGRSFLERFTPTQLSNVTQLFSDLVHGENLERKQLEMTKKDGTNAIVEINASPIMMNGEVTGIQAVFRDITERKLMEQKIVESEERMKQLIEFAPDAIYSNDLNGIFLDGNKRAEELVGYRKEELIGKSLFEVGLISEKSLQKVIELLEKNARGERTGPDEIELIRKDGTPTLAEISTMPVKRGNSVEVLGIARDITERKRIENALRDSEEKYRLLFENVNDVVFSYDSTFKITSMSPSVEKALGYKPEELIGKSIKDVNLMTPESMDSAISNAVRALSGGKLGAIVYEFIRKDGTIGWGEVNSSPLIRDGKVDGLIVVARDVTERKEMQEKLEEYSQQLETLVEQRTKQLKEAQEQLIKTERLAAIGQVAAMVGHDLRNPLTGISGATYYLKNRPSVQMDKKSGEMIELIEKDIAYSDKIITDLTDYSREIKLEFAETTPKSIMTEALTVVRVPQEVQIIDLTLDEPKMELDIEKAKRVFSNLIKNAVEAMPEGGKLTLQSKEKDDTVEFVFTDTGVGITKEDIERVWTPFFTTKAKGMGLGLPICRRIIEAHEGKISVESKIGEGTTFTITIPRKPKKTENEGGEKVWVNMLESSLSTTMKASGQS